MPNYLITYDVRATNHSYQPLYDQLDAWGAAHLQNSVWLATLAGPAETIRDILRAHTHNDDTVAVVQLRDGIPAQWATWKVRQTGVNWLRAKYG